MRLSTRVRLAFGSFIIAGAVVFGLTIGARAESFDFLFEYGSFTQDRGPRGSLAQGSDGSIYGATFALGPGLRGAVFKLTPAGQTGTWNYSAIEDFSDPDVEGRLPKAGVTLGPKGVVYGTNSQGGPNDGGVAFRLTPPKKPDKPWKKQIIHNFGLGEGYHATTEMLLGPDGELYGTTEMGGPDNCGVAFRLAPTKGSKPWIHTVLARFARSKAGCVPRSSLITDTDGNLYGTTVVEGKTGGGAVYRLEPQKSGKYKTRVLYAFRSAGNVLRNPEGGLALDAAGNLFGVARFGGAADCGGVYRLSPPAAGKSKWTYKAIRAFSGGSENPCNPVGLALTAGSIAVTAYAGGPFNTGGLFALKPTTTSKLRLLGYFNSINGFGQGAPLVNDGGEIFGTTSSNAAIWRYRP